MFKYIRDFFKYILNVLLISKIFMLIIRFFALILMYTLILGIGLIWDIKYPIKHFSIPLIKNDWDWVLSGRVYKTKT